jgi:TolA-binding protein
MKTLIPVLFSIFLLASCDGCKDGGAQDTIELDIIVEAQKSIASDPSRENVEKVLSNISSNAIETTQKEERKQLLESGYEIARSHDQNNKAINFLLPLLKEYPQAEVNRDYLYFIGETMIKTKNRKAAELILTGFIENFPDDPRIEAAKKLIQEPILDKDAFIQKMAEAVFENPDEFGINRVNAQKYVDICEAHALVYPNDKNTPLYLYRAGEISVAIRTFAKSLTIYDWLIDFYPDYVKTPNALFAKGYLMEEELKKPERARMAFSKFLETYPEHELADDAKFLLENIGKSGDEIIKIIEANREKQEVQ